MRVPRQTCQACSPLTASSAAGSAPVPPLMDKPERHRIVYQAGLSAGTLARRKGANPPLLDNHKRHRIILRVWLPTGATPGLMDNPIKASDHLIEGVIHRPSSMRSLWWEELLSGVGGRKTPKRHRIMRQAGFPPPPRPSCGTPTTTTAGIS